MAYLNANIPTTYAQIRREYLYDLKNVIRLRGQLQPSSSAFLDGQEVYTYKGVTLYHNAYPKDGSFRIASYERPCSISELR